MLGAHFDYAFRGGLRKFAFVAQSSARKQKEKAAIAACQSRFDSGFSYKINPTAFSIPENFPKHSVNFQ